MALKLYCCLWNRFSSAALGELNVQNAKVILRATVFSSMTWNILRPQEEFQTLQGYVEMKISGYFNLCGSYLILSQFA